MDAQVAISQLHRYRIGHKRITIAYANSDGTNPQQLRAQIISLLQVFKYFFLLCLWYYWKTNSYLVIYLCCVITIG